MQQEICWGATNGLLRSWKVQPGSKVVEGEILALVEPVSFKLAAPVSGTLLSCLVRNNTKIVAEQVVCVISTCTHPILTITDVCTTCHVNLHETSEYAFYITPSNHPIKRRVADVEAESMAKTRALLSSQRLVLVLDLDQTVLHAALVNGYEGPLSCALDPPQKDVFVFELSGRSRMIVKFRPGLREFLLEAHRLYEIHVYTMANAEYAAKIVDLINTQILADVEPLLRQQIIGTRIITRSHTEDSYEMQLKQQGGPAYVMKLREKRKDIKHIVGDSSIAVIVDDSDGVWPDYLDHLIQIYPFVYWPNQEDLNKTFHDATAAVPSTPSRPNPPPRTNEQAITQLTATLPKPTPKKRVSEANLDDLTKSDSEETLEDGVKRQKSAEISAEEQDAEHKLIINVTENATSAAPLTETEQLLLKAATIAPQTSGERDPPTSQEKSDSDPATAASPHLATNPEDSLPPRDAATVEVVVDPRIPRAPSPAPLVVDPRLMPLLLPFGIRHLPSSDKDTLLHSMLGVLTRMHAEFFALPENSKLRHVQLILPRMRQQVLKGRKICLSGVIPHQPKPSMDDKNNSMTAAQKSMWPEQNKAGMREILRLEQFGAIHEENVTPGNPERITHLVSARGSTMKVRTASQAKSVYCVTKLWLDQSIIHWKIANESDFKIPDIPLCNGPVPSFPDISEGSLWTEADLRLDIQATEDENATANGDNGFHAPAPSSPLSDSYVDLESLLQADYDISEEAEEEDQM